MNINKQQSYLLGAVLIVTAVVMWLNLWWLVLPTILLGGGVVGYVQRKKFGRPVEAIQLGLWGIGLAILLLTHFFFPGILILAGASLLARGREEQIETYLQTFVSNVKSRRSARPLTTQQIPVSGSNDATPSVETTRLSE